MPGNKRRPLAERFWEKVDKRGPDECWLWKAATNRRGYGFLRRWREPGSSVLAHRIAYELLVGPIPAELFACHHCDNPPCVNPRHLFVGTQKDNMADASRKGRARGPTGQTCGSDNGNSKLTWTKVAKIRASTKPRKEVIREFGISKTQYWHIRTGAQWQVSQ